MLARAEHELKVEDLCVVDYSFVNTPKAYQDDVQPTHRVVRLLGSFAGWRSIVELEEVGMRTLIDWKIVEDNLVLSVDSQVVANLPVEDIARAVAELNSTTSIENLVLVREQEKPDISIFFREGEIIYPVLTFTIKPKQEVK